MHHVHVWIWLFARSLAVVTWLGCMLKKGSIAKRRCKMSAAAKKMPCPSDSSDEVFNEEATATLVRQLAWHMLIYFACIS